MERELIKHLRQEYSKGTRVELVSMCDSHRNMPEGLKGTVFYVDDAGGIHINWENGSSLAALHGIDIIRKCD